MTIYATDGEIYFARNPETGKLWKSAEWKIESSDAWTYTKFNEDGSINRQTRHTGPGEGEKQQKRIMQAKKALDESRNN